MSDKNADAQIKVLSDQVELLINNQKGAEKAFNALIAVLDPQQKNAVKALLNERFNLAINQGAAGLVESVKLQKKYAEKLVGSLG